jgi:hypothetical protein
MTASSVRAVAGAGLIESKFRKMAGLDQLQVLIHRALHATVDLYPTGIEPPQGPGAYAPDHNSLHPFST